MTTFNGDKLRKEQYLARASQISVRLNRGEERERLYFSNACWCEPMYVCKHQAKGCQHRFYADEIGVPVALAYSERAIFLSLDDDAVGKWPRRFIESLPVGMSEQALNRVCREFALYILNDPTIGLYQYAVTPEHYASIGKVISLYQDGCTDAEQWRAAAQAAFSAGSDDHYGRGQSREAHIKAGSNAARAAAHLASAFNDPRRFADAVQWAAWSARYKRYAVLMAEAGDNWFSADRCESSGERSRKAMYTVYGDELLRLIKANARKDGHGLLGVLYQGLCARAGVRAA